MGTMKTYWAVFSILLASCEAAKILVVFPMPSRSHGNLGDGVVRNLLKAGHEVTYVSPFQYKNAPANLRTIDVSSNFDVMPQDMLSIKSIMDNSIKIEDTTLMVLMMTGVMTNTAGNKDFQKIMNDPNEKFDAVISEWLFSDLPAGYAAVFDCPFIWLSSVEIHWMILKLIDQPSNPAYTVDVMSPYTPPLGFMQRVNELWIQLKIELLNYLYIDGVQSEAYEKYLAPSILKRGRQPPSFNEVRYNASLVLGNSYASTGLATAIPQNYKLIGGYHIEESVQTLPEDLKKLMDNAKDGVIYFSMGSNLKSKDLPDEIKKNILKMFGTLKQTVLWKFEEVMPDLPPNVHILKWAPQPAILSHPNLAVFITHGGLLSTTEAVHFGVPIIGIPVFADQFMNVIKAMNKGFALRVDLSYSMADKLKEAIVEVTTNKGYAVKAKELSFIHHDRPVKPGAELAHWVQHVISTRGAPHLRSPALHVPLYQKLYLDLAAVIAAILVVVLILLKRVCALVCPKKKAESGKKNN